MLSKQEEGRNLKEGCRRLEGLTLQLFGTCGWKNQKRIGLLSSLCALLEVRIDLV